MATNDTQLTRPRLIAITDPDSFGQPETRAMVEQVCSRAKPGSVMVQLRSQGLSIRERYRLGLQLQDVCVQFEQTLCVNDRLDLALALKVPYLHLKGSSLAVGEARALLSARLGHSWISQAWHWGDEPVGIQSDALIVSPALQARKGRPALGLACLRQLALRLQPSCLYALGGVTAGTAGALVATGMTGVASIRECYERGAELVAGLDIAR